MCLERNILEGKTVGSPKQIVIALGMSASVMSTKQDVRHGFFSCTTEVAKLLTCGAVNHTRFSYCTCGGKLYGVLFEVCPEHVIIWEMRCADLSLGYIEKEVNTMTVARVATHPMHHTSSSTLEQFSRSETLTKEIGGSLLVFAR